MSQIQNLPDRNTILAVLFEILIFLHFFRMAGAVRLQTIESPDNDPTCVTYIMHGEDDTLGNSLRLELPKLFFAS